MRDPVVETELRLLTLQVESWKRLHSFITYALDKTKPIISVEQEREFTEARGILFQESEHVFEELSLVEQLSGKLMNVLHRATSVRGVRELPTDELRRLEADWNAVFTKMGLVLGQLKARRKELRSQSAFSHALSGIFAQKSSDR